MVYYFKKSTKYKKKGCNKGTGKQNHIRHTENN